jgi:hypothetical protein
MKTALENAKLFPRLYMIKAFLFTVERASVINKNFYTSCRLKFERNMNSFRGGEDAKYILYGLELAKGSYFS